MSGRRFHAVVLAAAVMTVLGSCLPAAGAPPAAGRPAGQDLNVDGEYTVSGTEYWQNVLVKSTGSLVVPPGAALNAISIILQDGSFQVTGGTVTVVQTVPGARSSIFGRCSVLNLTQGATITVIGPSGGQSLEDSTGGQASVEVTATVSITVTGGSRIECTGGSALSRSEPWTTGPLEGYISAGGEAVISLGGGSTPYIEVSGGAQLVATGRNGGRAADGRPGAGDTGGKGGGYSNGGAVGGHVGAGGDGRVELAGLKTVLHSAQITCNGGRGGDAGRGGAGSKTPGSLYYYSSGGGGGGYGGGNGGSEYMNAGQGGTVRDFVGAGGGAVLSIDSPEVVLGATVITLTGGDGGTPGQGGEGGVDATYPYYSGGGGGGGFGGGGGGSSYATGGSGSVQGDVGAGGEANMTLSGGNLTIDGLALRCTGGSPQEGAQGGAGAGGGGGGGGYGGGGGGGGLSAGGSGQTSGNVGSGGTATLVITGARVDIVNSTVDLDGGAAADGGAGGNGGTYGGGGGGGYGGGGGAGYYNYYSPAGPGSCGQNVGRGGAALYRLSTGTLWANNSVLNITGGSGGNAGEAGKAVTAGGGGGGYAGSGGGGYYGTGGEGTAGQFSGDGGESSLELYCDRGSFPENGVRLEANGGTKGDGLTQKGGGAGGSGKGRATSDGPVSRNIPRLVPIPRGPPDGTMFNGPDPVLYWMGCIDGVVFPARPDPVKGYGIEVDDDPAFPSPELQVLDIPPGDRSYTPVGLLGGEYHWRLCAVYSGGAIPGWSAAGRFFKNGPPRLVSDIPPLFIEEDGGLRHAVDLDDHFTDDLYSGELSYAIDYVEDPSLVRASLDGPWLDLQAVRADWHGTCNFSVRATDKGGISGLSNTFTVTVTPVNDAPRFMELPAVEVTEDRDFRFDITPYIADIDNGQGELRISVRSPHAVVEGHVITLHYSTEVGTDLVPVTLSDGRLSATTDLEVTVAPVNDPPQALPVPDLQTAEDTPVVLDLMQYALDEEDGPAGLSWRVESTGEGPFNLSIDDRNLLTLSPWPDASGESVLTLVVSDSSGATAVASLGVRISAVNDPPVIGGLPEAVVKVGIPLKLDLRPYLYDADNPVSSLRVTSESPHATLSGFTVTLAYDHDERLGDDVVPITVSDGQASARGSISVRLLFPPLFSGAPESIALEAGTTVVLDLARFVSDREDGTSGLTWSLGRPDPLLLDAQLDGTGRLTLRSLGRDAADTLLTVSVTDMDGQSSEWTFRIRIAPPSSAGTGDRAAATDPVLPAVVVAALLIGTSALVYVYSRRKNKIKRNQYLYRI